MENNPCIVFHALTYLFPKVGVKLFQDLDGLGLSLQLSLLELFQQEKNIPGPGEKKSDLKLRKLAQSSKA